MPTANTIISQALRKIQALDSIENASGGEASDALIIFNQMLASWRLESLMAVSRDRVTGLALTASTQTYTIGTAGTWAVERPVKIERASLRYLPSSADLEYPIDVITAHEWQLISNKSVESTIPHKMWYEKEFDSNGLAKCHLWPVPSDATHQITLYVWNVLEAIATLATTLNFAPGYEEAIVYNLAIRLAPDYGVPVSQDIKDMAKELRANIKTINKQVRMLKTEGTLRSGSLGDYNIRTNRSG